MPFATILASNGIDDTVWCLRTVDDQKLVAKFALALANEVRHLTPEASQQALTVVSAFLDGTASRAELDKVTEAAQTARAMTVVWAAEAAIAEGAKVVEAAMAMVWAVEAAMADAAMAEARKAVEAAKVAEAVARATRWAAEAAEAAEWAARVAEAAEWAIQAAAEPLWAAKAAAEAAWVAREAVWAATIEVAEKTARATETRIKQEQLFLQFFG